MSAGIYSGDAGTTTLDISVNVGDQITVTSTTRILGPYGGNYYYTNATAQNSSAQISYYINDGGGSTVFNAPANGYLGPGNANYTVTAAMCPSCTAPSGLTATVISSSEVELNLTAGSSDSAYFVSYTDGNTTDTLLPAPTSLPFTVTGLLSNTDYTFYVGTYC